MIVARKSACPRGLRPGQAGLQKLGRALQFWIFKLVKFYYLARKQTNEGADDLLEWKTHLICCWVFCISAAS